MDGTSTGDQSAACCLRERGTREDTKMTDMVEPRQNRLLAADQQRR
jgi:hypothetical protein